jgi:hypothetical protein
MKRCTFHSRASSSVREKRLENFDFDFFALTLALAFTGPVFAGDVTAAKTEADCAKAGGTWNATTKMCEEKKM